MNESKQMLDFMMSMAFSLFGMLLIFGLGFVFPTIDPYVVIKWIVVACAVVFAYSVGSFLFGVFTMMKNAKKKKSSKK
ncbi:MAG: hypothetical protein Q8L28_01225 [bacterium]|nr:hypothetical protein [bacterium]